MALFGGNRVVSVTLKADIASFQGSLAAARKSVSDFSTAAERSAGKNAQEWTTLGTAVGGAGVALAAGVGAAVKAFADFDKQMSAVAAATRGTASELAALREAAVKAGADTAFSAVEAAQGIEELAKAGVATRDILGGGLRGALDLAAAGGLSVAEAAETSASALTQFGLKGGDVTHVADLLSAGAGKAQGSVHDMGAALNQVGLIANQSGLSIEETTGALAQFASAGLIGSDAGTSFKTMLLSLTPTSKEAATLMEELGLEFFDAQGQMIPFAGIAEELKTSLSGLSQEQQISALKTIFGTDAYRVAALVMEGGAEAARKWQGAVNDQGHATETAALKTQNLAGDLDRLQGSIDSALIQSGSGANDALRALVQTAEKGVDAFGALSPEMQQGAVALAAAASGAALLGGAALVTIPRIIELRTAMQTLGVTSTATGKAMAVAGKAITVVGVAAAAVEFAALSGAMSVATVEAKELDAALDSFGRTGALAGAGLEAFSTSTFGLFERNVENTSEALDKFAIAADNAHNGSMTGFVNRMLDMGVGASQFNAQVHQLDEGLARLVQNGRADEAKAAFDRLLASIDNPEVREQVGYQFKAYEKAVDAAAEAAKKAADAQTPMTKAVLGVGRSAEDAKKEIEGLSEAVLALAGALNQESANDAFARSLAGVKDAAKGASKELRGNSEATLNARASMRELVDAGLKVIDTMVKSGASQSAVSKTAAQLAGQIDRTGKAAGLAGGATKRYSDILREVPKTVTTAIKANGFEGLNSALNEVITKMSRIDGRVVTYRIRGESVNITTGGQTREARADGGMIPLGLGGPREDNVPAWLSSGEFVVNAAATRKNLPLLQKINAQRFADGGVVKGYADGGQIPVSEFFSRFDAKLGPPVTPDDLLKATTRQRQAIDAVRVAELRLAEVRRKKGATASQIAGAEAALAKKRDAVAAATRQLGALEARQAQQKSRASLTPLGRFAGALAGGVRDATAFVNNVETIASRGYGRLAQQLAAMGDAEAERIATSAAKASDQSLRQTTAQLRSASSAQGRVAGLGDSARILSAVAGGAGGSLGALSGATGLGYQDLIAALAFVKDRLAKDPRAKGVLADLAKYASTGSFASGGPVVGPGTGTSDSVLIRASAGEYVMKEAAVSRYGPKFMDDVNAMRWASDRVTSMASGASAGVSYGGDTVVVNADGPLIAQSAHALAAAVVQKQARVNALRSRSRP